MSVLIDISGAPLSSAVERVGPDGAPVERERACVACGCTERDACPGGCAWADAVVDICSRCAVLTNPYLVSLARAYIVAHSEDLDERVALERVLLKACRRLRVDPGELLGFVAVINDAAGGGE